MQSYKYIKIPHFIYKSTKSTYVLSIQMVKGEKRRSVYLGKKIIFPPPSPKGILFGVFNYYNQSIFACSLIFALEGLFFQ